MTEPNAPPAPMGPPRTRLIAILVLLLVFGSGVALGWAFTRRSWGPGPRDGLPPATREMFDRLHVTPRQRASIDSIFAARRTQIDGLWRAVLDSSQRASFDAMQREGPRRGGRGSPEPPALPESGPLPGPPPDEQSAVDSAASAAGETPPP